MTLADSSWREQAACRGLTETFFPVVATFPWSWDPARQICASCPVFDACLAFVDAHPQPEGMYGGLTPAQRQERRRRLVRRRERRAASDGSTAVASSGLSSVAVRVR